MKLKTNDKVIVTAGKDKGKQGKIIQIFADSRKVVVEGANILKKHIRSRKEGQKGQVIELPAPLRASNVSIFCEHCQKAVKIGYRIEADKKVRFCKKCQEVI